MVALGHIRNQQQEEITPNYEKIVELLMELDTNCHLGTMQNKQGDTPSHLAVRNLDVALVEIFDKYDLIFDIQNNANETLGSLINQVAGKVDSIKPIIKKTR